MKRFITKYNKNKKLVACGSCYDDCNGICNNMLKAIEQLSEYEKIMEQYNIKSLEQLKTLLNIASPTNMLLNDNNISDKFKGDII